MAWLGKDLQNHLVPTPCHGKGHCPQASSIRCFRNSLFCGSVLGHGFISPQAEATSQHSTASCPSVALTLQGQFVTPQNNSSFNINKMNQHSRWISAFQQDKQDGLFFSTLLLDPGMCLSLWDASFMVGVFFFPNQITRIPRKRIKWKSCTSWCQVLPFPWP